MLPFIKVAGITIPTYGLMAIIGFLVSVVFALQLTKVYNLEKQDLLFSSVYMIIGIVVGSKLLYVITYIPLLIKNFDVFLEYPWQVFAMVTSGFVFYGGLIGGALGVWIYARQFKIDVMKFADTIAPEIPLFHAFGRIGCFLGGCCYGIEYDGIFSIEYNYNKLVPELSEVPRFPVQLMESGLNLLLFVFLYIYGRKKRKPGMVLGLYLICYTIIRTITEMFRGDMVRGVTEVGLSTSQIISIILLPLGIWLVTRKEKKVS